MNFAAKNRVTRDETRLQRRRLAASGYVTPALVALLGAGLLAASYNHIRGNFHRLRLSVLKPEPGPPRPALGPGGQPPIHLARSSTSLGAYPEFMSMTLLPGRGMDVLQITALVPGRGEIPLLQAPPLEEAEADLTGSGHDLNGELQATFGATFLAPWAGTMTGVPSAATGRLENVWEGHRINFPASPTPGAPANQSTDGLLLDRAADSVQTGVQLDGQFADALFRLGSFNNAWVSSLDVETRIELTGHEITLTLTGRNVGTTSLPLGLGWKPYFTIPSGERDQALLYIPSSYVAGLDHHTGLPDGRWNLVPDGQRNFSKTGGSPLDGEAIDATFSNLHGGVLADGPTIELRDPAANYGMRMTLLSATINAVHVHSPADQAWVSIEPATNVGNPFGAGWTDENGSGIRILRPGESLTWKVRLEIFALAGPKDNEP